MSDPREGNPWEDFDVTERACSLHVLRKHWNDSGDKYLVELELCGSPLHVEYAETRPLLVGGEMELCGTTWQVVCENGHVLVLPDHQGDDSLHHLTFNQALVEEALAALSTRPVERGSEA